MRKASTSNCQSGVLVVQMRCIIKDSLSSFLFRKSSFPISVSRSLVRFYNKTSHLRNFNQEKTRINARCAVQFLFSIADSAARFKCVIFPKCN